MSELAAAFRAQIRDAVVAKKAPDYRAFRSIFDGVSAEDSTITLLRADDLLLLRVRLVNLRRRNGRFERRNPGNPARLVVEHQPQSFGEEAFLETGDQSEMAEGNTPISGRQNANGSSKPSEPLKTEPIGRKSKLAIARPSRIAHVMPDSVESIPATLPGLLAAMRSWPLGLHDNAQPDGTVIGVGMTAAIGALARGAISTAIGTPSWRTIDAGVKSAVAKLAAMAGRGTMPSGASVADDINRLVDAVIPRRRGEDIEVTTDRAALTIYVQAEIAGGWSFAANTDAGWRVAAEGFDFAVDGSRDLLRRPSAPGPTTTAIEMPFRLLATPLPGAGFAHADLPVTHQGRTELWHSRLGRRVQRAGQPLRIDDDDGTADGGGWNGERLRFLWSPDMVTDSAADAFRMPLSPNDRRMLVKLTVGYDEKIGRTPFVPRAAFVRRLMLTALGGDLEAQRRWDQRPSGVDLTAWTHRAAIGRDYFVRVEYSGFLLPFRHRASLIKITERKFQTENGKRVARLRQRFFIVVRDRVMPYVAAVPNPDNGLAHPFVAVECLTDVTPNLDAPGEGPDSFVSHPSNFYSEPTPDADRRMAFWPQFEAKDLSFKFMGVDRSGRRIPFEMPLMFVSEVQNIDGRIDKIIGYYNRSSNIARRTADLGGRTVQLMPTSAGAGQVDYPTVKLVYKATAPTTGLSTVQDDALQAWPIVTIGEVELTALQALTGQPRRSEFKWYRGSVGGTIGDNAGGMFAELIDPAPVTFGSGVSSDKAGAIATPNLNPTGLSALHGIVSGSLNTIQKNNFVPGDFLPDAKLLGVFTLAELLHPGMTLSNPEAPRISTRVHEDRIETLMQLTQFVRPGDHSLGLITASNSQLVLDILVTTPVGEGTPRHKVEGTLTNFGINLAGVIILRFDRLRFLKDGARKPDVDVDLNPVHAVTFGGPLAFLNKIKEYIPANGFSDPPDLQITPAGLTASYELGLPPMEIGVLSISNVMLGAAFSLPFTGGPPTARFNFAERHNCFNLTVSLLGGGGFMAIVVGADGVKEIEAQLDFGARVAIDLGVASGMVYIKVGFYFHYAEDGPDEEVEFEGFVEICGRLSVMGMITVSLTFHVALCFESVDQGVKPDGSPRSLSRLFGQATLTVEVEVLLWSGSVSITVEKTFIGSEADPSFAQLMETPAIWADYCDAFA
jgi:hypothetical protein